MGKHFKTIITSLWIRIATLGAVLVILTETLFLVYTKKMTRPRADHITKKFGSLLLNIVKVKRHYYFQTPLKYEPGRCYMIMSNHCSLYDIPLMFEGIPGSVRMLAKKELYKIPLFGLALKTNEFIFIDRQNRQQALEALKYAKEKMESGIILWVAPEGTRTRTGKLLPFKKGVFHLAMDTNALIIPVGINGINRVLPTKTWQFSLNERVDVNIGEIIDTRKYNESGCKQLMHVVEKSIRELLDKKEVPAGSD